MLFCNFIDRAFITSFADAVVLTYGLSSGSGVIWLADVQCEGNESRLIDCPANQLGFTNCDHSRDVGVTCSATNCTHGNIRFHRLGRNFGRVEICISNIWGVVCADSWSIPDLEVSCSQLGLPVISKLFTVSVPLYLVLRPEYTQNFNIMHEQSSLFTFIIQRSKLWSSVVFLVL